MYALITSDWILDEAKLESKNSEEIEVEILSIRESINTLKEESEKKNEFYLKNQIILLQYKESELTEFLTRKETENLEQVPVVLQKQISSKKNN